MSKICHVRKQQTHILAYIMLLLCSECSKFSYPTIKAKVFIKVFKALESSPIFQQHVLLCPLSPAPFISSLLLEFQLYSPVTMVTKHSCFTPLHFVLFIVLLRVMTLEKVLQGWCVTPPKRMGSQLEEGMTIGGWSHLKACLFTQLAM